MALPTQGLGIVGTTIRNSGIVVASHLQFINWSNQHELEIDNDIIPLDWMFRIDAVDPATFGRPDTDFANTGAIDLGGRLADNVWQVAIQATYSFDAAGLTYELTTQNSNSYINSLMLSLGIDLGSYLDTVTPQSDGLGFVGVGTDVRDKVAFTISGTSGADWFFSGAKNDILNGGDGDDFFISGAGTDWIRLGNGNDYAEGGAGADAIYGDSGSDTVSYSSSAGGVTVYLSQAYAAGGDAQGDYLDGIENIIGSALANDVLIGNGQSNILMGQGGSDWLSGLAGNDYLLGGDGVDSLLGGTGSDQLTGGAGGDYFQLLGTDLIAGDTDYVMDFSSAEGDYVLLPAAMQASTYFASYGSYAFGYVWLGTAAYVFFAANSTASDLQSHTYFF